MNTCITTMVIGAVIVFAASEVLCVSADEVVAVIEQTDATLVDAVPFSSTVGLTARYLPPEGQRFIRLNVLLRSRDGNRGSIRYDDKSLRLLVDGEETAYFGTQEFSRGSVGGAYPSVSFYGSDPRQLTLLFIVPGSASEYKFELGEALQHLEPREAEPQTERPTVEIVNSSILTTPARQVERMRFGQSARTVELKVSGMRILAVEVAFTPGTEADEHARYELYFRLFWLEDEEGVRYPIAGGDFSGVFSPNISSVGVSVADGAWKPVHEKIYFLVAETGSEFTLHYDDSEGVNFVVPMEAKRGKLSSEDPR